MRTFSLALLFAVVLVLPACSPGGKQPAKVLSGRVTFNGQPLTAGTLMIAGPNNDESSAQIREDGSYELINPPTGTLKFKLFMVSPPPDRPANPPVLGQPSIPERYHVYENELNFDYSGGRERYDVSMTI